MIRVPLKSASGNLQQSVRLIDTKSSNYTTKLVRPRPEVPTQFDDIMLGSALPIITRNESAERVQTTPSVSSPTHSSQRLIQSRRYVEKVRLQTKGEGVAIKTKEFPF